MSDTFQVTARKWRPMRFDDVVGQEHITRTLKNAIAAGRLAHAFLFTGQRGCGKTTVARILAKAINCPNAPKNGYEPCNTCNICLAITQGRSMDVAEIDGASNNGVDDVRMLRDNVKYPPLEGAYKVIIIDEVHMLSNSAFNALLKTLEEPPRHLVFVFATTEVQKVLPTILSRTQRYDFRRIQLEEITGRLRTICDAEGITIGEDALLIIAKKADGSMRDAQSVLDQVIAYCGMTVETARMREALNLIDLDFYFEVSEAIAARDARRAFSLSGEIVSRGYDIEEFLSGLLEHFRNLLTVTITSGTALLEVSNAHKERYATHAKEFSEGDLLRLIHIGRTAYERLQTTHDPRIVLEVSLVEMMLLERAIEIAELLSEIRALRGSGIAPGVPAIPAEKKSEGPQRNGEVPQKNGVISGLPNAASPNAESNVNGSSSDARNPKFGSRSAAPEARTASDRAPLAEATMEPQAIASRWNEFGEFLRTKSKPLFSIFPEIEFCGIRRTTVFLAVPGKIQKDMLMSLKDELQLALREFFGAALLFEAGMKADMQTRAGSPVLVSPEIVTQVLAAAPAGTESRSELEIALIERLGAQPV